jgi:hypothetical protein
MGKVPVFLNRSNTYRLVVAQICRFLPYILLYVDSRRFTTVPIYLVLTT